MSLYSIKMRAEMQSEKTTHHISGAEKIVSSENISSHAEALINRALCHSKGSADFVNIKIERVANDSILYLDALPTQMITVENSSEGLKKIAALLEQLNIFNTTAILEKISETYNMRGAMLLNVDTLERLEPDYTRGIRATYMDVEYSNISNIKNYYQEAIVLATKVAHAPNIIGEICISDDPNYVIGYVAGKDIGYVRISKLKELGDYNGGRIFLYRGDSSQAQSTIDFLQKQHILVRNISPESALEQTSKWDFMQKELTYLEKNHLYRTMMPLASAQSSYVKINNKDILLLSSNSYLDLANNSVIKSYAAKILAEFGVGSGGSRLTTGTTVLHDHLEKLLADFKGTEASLVFNTGYMANLGIVSALCSSDTIIFSDELNHASIIDGCRLSKAKVVIYKHNDMDDLEIKVKTNPCSRGIVITDAVFSMDGDIADLPSLMKISRQYNLFLMVDEAHSTGVLGKTGRGITEHYNLSEKPDIIMGTLSKAIGSEGGFVCGNNILIEYLKNKARSFIFSTALSPTIIATAIKAIELIINEPQRTLDLQDNIKYFCHCLQQKGLNVHSETAIIPIIIGAEDTTLKIAQELFDQGFYLTAIRYPTVKKSSARLRVTLMSTHTKEDLLRAAEAISSTIDHCL